jgi:uncharacterized repeat protein (TIGR01451 family)
MKTSIKKHTTLTTLALLGIAGMVCSSPSFADNVGQISTAKRISRQTVVLIDPQGRPGVAPANTDTTVQVGDILTFVIQFTPVPNGATRGLGGYVTDYIPRNTEVVGARLVDKDGNTVAPHRGGYASDGVGPRGDGTFVNNLPQGSMTQLYADTGIFFSTSLLTERYPVGDVLGEEFLTLFNGLLMNPEPTAAGKMGEIVGAGNNLYAHNRWDLTQAFSFGVNGGAIRSSGQGNTPHFYGSPVAGPESWYPYEATFTGLFSSIPTIMMITASTTTGPWQRIKTKGGEIGTLAEVPDANGDMPKPGVPTRNGILALDALGAPLGRDVSPGNPLPSYDPANPNQAYTTAVRFAVGELVVGEEYFAEISLRVKATPLDPVVGMDVNCAEVFGGDASARSDSGSDGGKDNAWRYFLPNPSCVVLNNVFEFSVDRLAALNGERLTYAVEGKNLSTNAQTGVEVRQCFVDGNFVSASNGGVIEANSGGCPNGEDAVLWVIGNLAPGDTYSLTSEFDAGGGDFMVHRAIYTSTALPFPGFQVVAATTVKAISIIRIDAVATPSLFAMGPGTVQYGVSVTNVGTGAASSDRVLVTLPPGFLYSTGTATVGGIAVGNPTVTALANGDILTFSTGLVDLQPGGSTLLGFDASFGGMQPDGAYTIGVETWFDGAFGRKINDARAGLAEVLLGITRSSMPTLTGPILSGATRVSGTSAEPAGAIVTVYVNGIPVGTSMVDANGSWLATIPAVFAGQNVTASVATANKLDSGESAPPIIVSTAGGSIPCRDGLDNDNDGLIDFPDDPGCVDASDLDETDPPECSDGIDNDNDGNTDYPDDPKCASFRDAIEGGLPECSDGVDNDGDGQTDTNDPDCADGSGRTETGLPACADGLDNDNDGLTDFPFDDGCDSAIDTDETVDTIGIPDMGVVDVDMGTTDDAGGDSGDGRINPGGVNSPPGGGSLEDGCCSSVAGRRPMPLALIAMFGFAWLIRRRLRA